MILCGSTDNPFGVDLIDIFERKTAVGAALFKLIHFEIYVPDFDEFCAVGFFNITVKNTLINLVVSGNVVKLAFVIFCFFVYF